MKKIFADTVYWIALLNPNDSYHNIALSVTQQQNDTLVVTTDAVLSEFLNQFTSYGTFWRNAAATEIENLLLQESVTVIQSSRELFLQGLILYKSRPDKQYSHVDCMSMVVMKNENINEVLSSDHHFEQEGFSLLLSL